MRATLEIAIENKCIVRMMINDYVRLLEGTQQHFFGNKHWC